jgi:ketosteroid isomerase-like protein
MSIEAKLAIQEMIAQYSYTYDNMEADAFAQVFVENGVFEVFVPGLARPAVRLQSRQEIQKWAAQRMRERDGRFTSRHYQSGIRFDELTDAEARLRVMVLVTRQEATDPRPYVSLTGVYHDLWRKTSGGWRLAHRAAYTDRDPGFAK